MNMSRCTFRSDDAWFGNEMRAEMTQFRVDQ